MQAHVSRWGYHAIDRETFHMLKALHKEVWEQYYKLRRWMRVTDKEEQNRPEKYPDPEDCSFCDRGWSDFPHYHKTESGEYERYVIHLEDGWGMSEDAQAIIDDYRSARTPAESPAEVQPLLLDRQRIRLLHYLHLQVKLKEAC